MAPDLDEVLKTLLGLPKEVRAALAGELLSSLDDEGEADEAAAWGPEIQRRLDEVDSGAVKTIPWAEVKRRLALAVAGEG
ncbi:MAG: addiction module protein [Deltaproteobacteria bacterium]|nr:addiction module protein [Deltaproteobacteria bacterium]